MSDYRAALEAELAASRRDLTACSEALIRCGDHATSEIAALRRDLATRDRELAEARDIADKYEAKADATAAERDRARGEIADLLARADADAFMLTQVGRERDAARAALAEKEREVARLKEDHAADLAVSDREEKLLEEHLAAAQEEAKRLRAFVERVADNGRMFVNPSPFERAAIKLMDALAARQQHARDVAEGFARCAHSLDLIGFPEAARKVRAWSAIEGTWPTEARAQALNDSPPSGINQGSGAGEALVNQCVGCRAGVPLAGRVDQCPEAAVHAMICTADSHTPPPSPASPAGVTRDEPPATHASLETRLAVAAMTPKWPVPPASAPGGAPGVETALQQKCGWGMCWCNQPPLVRSCPETRGTGTTPAPSTETPSCAMCWGGGAQVHEPGCPTLAVETCACTCAGPEKAKEGCGCPCHRAPPTCGRPCDGGDGYTCRLAPGHEPPCDCRLFGGETGGRG